MTIVAAVLAIALCPVAGWMVEAATGTAAPRLKVAASLVTAVVIAIVTWPADPVPRLLAVPLAAWGVTLAFVDLSRHRLPDVLVLSAYPPIGAVLIVAAVGSGEPDALLRAGTAAAAALATFGPAAVSGGLGFGDAKLAGLLGLLLGWVSWTSVLAGGLLALGFAAVPAAWAWVRRGRRSRFAFGPPLLLGALAGLAVA